MSASFPASQGPGNTSFQSKYLGFCLFCQGGRVFLRGCRSKWFELDDENGRMDGFLSQRFQGKQPTHIHISDRNIGFAFLVVAPLKIASKCWMQKGTEEHITHCSVLDKSSVVAAMTVLNEPRDF